MKANLILMLGAAAILGACNNNPTSTSATSTADSTQTSTTTQMDANNPAAKDTAMANSSSASVPDSTFLSKATNIGNFEIKIAKLAKQKSQNAKVKEFADMMIKEHTDMGKDVAALIQKKGYSAPTSLPADMQAKWDELNKLSGKDFDKKYAEINTDGHKEAIDLFTQVSNGSQDADVKKLATDALPHLKQHEEHASMLKDQTNS